VSHCGICERRLDHDWDPYYVENDPGHYDGDVYLVRMGNGRIVRSCWSCWMKVSPIEKPEVDWVRFEAERDLWNEFHRLLVASPDLDTFEASLGVRDPA